MAQSMSGMAPNSHGSVLNTNPRVPHTMDPHHGYCLTVGSSMPAGCCYSTAHLGALAARKSGSHSSCHRHHSTANSMAGCCYKLAHSSGSSRLQTPRCFQNPPTAAGLHARTVLLGCWRHWDGWTMGCWTMRCRTPAAHGHDLWRCLAPTRSATRCCYPCCCPADSPKHCHSAHCHSMMHAH
jgi:hypothetical protein